jgi:hypothetical protein
MNGWQKAWFVVSTLWALLWILLAAFGLGVVAVVIAITLPIALYVIGLAIAWVIKAMR